MKKNNVLIIMSDEHNPLVMGNANHPDVITPHLDALSKEGTQFINANCASPICVPARASLATGRYIFETGYWDNVDGFDGKTPTWHHTLREAGHTVTSIGKLHYRGWAGDDYGFSQSLLPMHLHNGTGELRMLLRNPPVSIGDGSNLLRSAKAGLSDYNHYDNQITEQAIDWLQQRSSNDAEKPWVLMVSLVAPHFPLTVPAPYFNQYHSTLLHPPKDYCFGIDTTAHPFIQQYAKESGYNLHFKSEEDVQRALSGYYGLVSYLDDKVGQLCQTLKQTGLDENTLIIYVSDHGDNAGARGLWGKSTMYKESVGTPLIIKGPNIKKNHTETAAVSHIDIYNTILEAVGHPLSESTASSHSQSLLSPISPNRVVLSEYHTFASRSAIFMLQDQHTKFIHYCDHPPQLFNLQNDPDELVDLSTHPNSQTQLADWKKRLYQFCNPQLIDQKAKQRQQELIEQYGGRETILAHNGIGGYTPSPLSTK